MTELIYQNDSYIQSFDAQVIQVDKQNNGVVLDRTAFFPGGGGQPADFGFLTCQKETFAVKRAQRIAGQLVHLIEGGMWVLAMIILFASIVVPVLKLVVLSFLLISVKKKSSWRPRDRTLLFRVTEGVGAWSMVDIYVVALLIGLVNFGALSTIRPGIGATFFGAVVVITMFAAHSFDPRLIWDNSGRTK